MIYFSVYPLVYSLSLNLSWENREHKLISRIYLILIVGSFEGVKAVYHRK